MFFSMLLVSAFVALVVALAIKLACKIIYGAAPSYGNAWLGAFAGAVAGSVVTPLFLMTFGPWMGASLLSGVVAFLVQAAVFKKVLRIEGKGELSYGESFLMALVAALLLALLMPLSRILMAALFVTLGSLI